MKPILALLGLCTAVAVAEDIVKVSLVTTNGLVVTYESNTTNPPPFTLNYHPVIQQTNSNNTVSIVSDGWAPVTVMAPDNVPLRIYTVLEASYDATNWFVPDHDENGYWVLGQTNVLVRARVCTGTQPP